MTAETFAPWPPNPVETALRAKIEATEALVIHYEARGGLVPAPLIRKALDLGPRPRPTREAS